MSTKKLAASVVLSVIIGLGASVLTARTAQAEAARACRFTECDPFLQTCRPSGFPFNCSSAAGCVETYCYT